MVKYNSKSFFILNVVFQFFYLQELAWRFLLDAILEKDVPILLQTPPAIVSTMHAGEMRTKSGNKVYISSNDDVAKKKVYALADRLYAIIDKDFSFCEKPIVYIDKKYDDEGIYSMYATFSDGAYLPVLAVGLEFSKTVSDSILMSMMAHEIGHLLARHSPLITATRILQEDVNNRELHLQDEFDVLLRNSLYRKLENEADLIELYFLKQLGYTKEDAKEALQYVISKNEKARELLAVNATHISLDERIHRVDVCWEKIEKGYVPLVQEMRDRGLFFEKLRVESDSQSRYRKFLDRENTLYSLASQQVEEEIEDLKNDKEFSKIYGNLSLDRRNALLRLATKELQLYDLERTTVHPENKLYRARFLQLMDNKKELICNLRVSSLF